MAIRKIPTTADIYLEVDGVRVKPNVLLVWRKNFINV